MELVKKYKNILIVAGVLAAIVLGYLWWSGRDTTDSSTLSFAPDGFGLPTEASIAGQQILSVLEELRQLNINGSVFQNAVFKSLIDHTIATTSEPLGRPDPFAPLPFESEEAKPK